MYKSLPLGCMHAASHCAIGCCHCLHPALFNALLLVYHHDPLSTSGSPTETNLMGLSPETECAKPLVLLIPAIFLHNLCSEILLPLCQNGEVLHHV